MDCILDKVVSITFIEMKCSKCGFKTIFNETVCGECGHSLILITAESKLNNKEDL